MPFPIGKHGVFRSRDVRNGGIIVTHFFPHSFFDFLKERVEGDNDYYAPKFTFIWANLKFVPKFHGTTIFFVV